MSQPTATPPAPNGAAPNGAAEPVGAGAVAPDATKPEGGDDRQVKKAYALLAKKERGLALKAHDLAQKAEAMRERQAEFEAWNKAKDNAKRDPVTHLKALYGDDWYDKLTEFKLSGGKVTPELVAASVDERLEAFEKKQEAQRLKDAEAAKAQVAAEEAKVLSQWRADVTGYVKQNAEAYELINHFEVHDRVTAKIESEFAKTQKLLTPKEAADLVEKDLEERGSKSKKLGKAPATPAPAVTTAEKRTDPLQRRTLSNDMTASTPATRPPPVDDKERRKRALEAMDAVRASRTKA